MSQDQINHSNQETKEGLELGHSIDEEESPSQILKRMRELGERDGIIQLEKEERRGRAWRKLKRPSIATSSAIALYGIGLVSLVSSAIYVSTVLAFIGLGLTFWGALLLFVRPQEYARANLIVSTGLSSLKTIDRIMNELGYCQKGIYIPLDTSRKVVVFVPSEPLTSIPKTEEMEKHTFIDSPKGIIVFPPGLELANLIENKLGGDLRKVSLETLRRRLPRLLVEDLEIFQDFEMQLDKNRVNIKFVEPIYTEFCTKLRGETKICSSLGCPILSAMACVLAQVSGKPIVFEKDMQLEKNTTESSYRVLEE